MNLLGITISCSATHVCFNCSPVVRRHISTREGASSQSYSKQGRDGTWIPDESENFAGMKCACYVAAVPCGFVTQKSNKYFLNLGFQRKMTFTSNCWQRWVRAHVWMRDQSDSLPEAATDTDRDIFLSPFLPPPTCTLLILGFIWAEDYFSLQHITNASREQYWLKSHYHCS